MIAHIVFWVLSKKNGWFGGRTTTPIEPSESMEFAKNGVINAGLIFFAIALLSTLILGRWFCGWGCHVVLLQDLCGWMMKKVGVRPKQFRSRFLIYVPLLLAIYMFILPAVHRVILIPLDASLASSLGDTNWLVTGWREFFGFLGVPLPLPNMPAWSASWHLTTTEFWRTFPGVMVAIPFLLVCGFATVYFLGAKGFCTYGCPYGGFFAPLDKLAPARIIVNYNCEQCGHCTAVCTSNVRVHEEVREYGMVVDPGCMKCLDCVRVCPNEALSFGFAKPAIMKDKANHAKP
jgi:polyferredoxin